MDIKPAMIHLTDEIDQDVIEDFSLLFNDALEAGDLGVAGIVYTTVDVIGLMGFRHEGPKTLQPWAVLFTEASIPSSIRPAYEAFTKVMDEDVQEPELHQFALKVSELYSSKFPFTLPSIPWTYNPRDDSFTGPH